LARATQSSVNTVYAQLNEEIGGEATKAAAVKAGLPEDTVGLDADLTNVLGTASPHVLDMTRVYATFAAGGMRHDSFIVDRVTNPSGDSIYTGAGPGSRAFSEPAMAELTYALERVVQYGTGQTVGDLDRPVAGKTGTSEHNQSAWFCGYIPQLATSVAFYQNGPNGEVQPITPFGENAVVQGGGPPAEMWLKLMAAITQDMPVEDFPDRPNKWGDDDGGGPAATPTATPTPSVGPSSAPPPSSVPPSAQPSASATPPPSGPPPPSSAPPVEPSASPSQPPPSASPEAGGP
jgi:membrane peptidoglycan carboxypeptidase